MIAALLGTVLAGCQKEVDVQNPEEQPSVDKGWTLTIQASKGVDTKALSYDGDNNTLSPYWVVGETVDVYLVGDDKIGTLEVESVDGSGVATLTGDISVSGLTAGTSILKLLSPGEDRAWSYVNQNGIAPDEDFDFATSCLKVTEKDVTNKVITTVGYNPSTDETVANPSFSIEQSVYRFTFLVNSSPIDVKSFTMSSTQNLLVASRTFNGTDWTSAYGPISAAPTTATSDHRYYLSVRNENSGTTNNYSFTVVDRTSNALYEGPKDITGKQLVNGKLYNATVNLTQKTIPQNTDSQTVDTAM